MSQTEKPDYSWSKVLNNQYNGDGQVSTNKEKYEQGKTVGLEELLGGTGAMDNRPEKSKKKHKG